MTDDQTPQTSPTPPSEQTEGDSNNLATSMTFGMLIGMAIGLLILDNIGLGLSLGMLGGIVFSLIKNPAKS